MRQPPFGERLPYHCRGAGTWGASTALYLGRRGYTNVVVLDPHPYPSPISAGNDVNKIAETISWRPSGGEEDDRVPVETHIAARTSEGWLNDHVFKPYYHDTGFIAAASTPDAFEFFRQTMPEGVLTGDFPNWKGFWKKRGAGWVHARNAYVSAAEEAQRLGVRFLTGTPEGKVTGLLYSDSGDVVGVTTADGKEHHQLLDFKDQLRPTAWTLAHIKMEPSELPLYKNLPVLFNVERGFFMEPDEERHELKICDEHPGYTNFKGPCHEPAAESSGSVPFAKHQIPEASEERVRNFLRETMPQLANRPSLLPGFLIDTHPDHPSLILGVGASGHGFAHITSIGGFIAIKDAFRWRPETAVNRDWKDLQGRWGVERRVMDFGEVKEWTDVGDRREC
ncbi:FAD dependent oxidoreductase [Fomitopsis serialis]|uniref:FAD dependent oxidoreductase n=1 Tax=Fomitopsis serialis TaxID=139415 RepID=UPI0020087547|nr:FAD dependent oxidoreductase [Neoantrodia serialis]KAH9934767.1 FAD dependent oxidoreductase [Neoantrodia serialis]